MKKGILLIQLGTPEAPTVSGVRRYLRLFLSDKRVITLPRPLRYLLLYLIILPIRSKRSAKAYQAIWTKKGAPLRILTQTLTDKLQKKLKSTHHVTYGMRYGEPSLKKALQSLKTCESITILPLYPQYASSSTGSAIEAVFDYFKAEANMPALHIIRDFYRHPAFIEAQSLQIKPYLNQAFEHLLFSYHGLPLSHLSEMGCEHICKKSCTNREKKLFNCYRAQCFETSQKLGETLKLSPSQYTTAFQSRLGRAKWIEPYTEKMLESLRQSGVKNLAVACPAFTVDCLETLEEIGIQANATWQRLGGETLTLIPALNHEDHFVLALEAILTKSHPHV